MISLGNRFCYFCASVALSEEDLREFLQEPLAALPPVVAARLPEIRILLVPYLAKGAQVKPRSAAEPLVVEEKPADSNALQAGSVVTRAGAVLAFAVKDTEVSDYHYRFYRSIADLLAGEHGEDVPPQYTSLLKEELQKGAHGEVDEDSWRLKELLDEKDRRSIRDTKRFRDYSRQSFIDTITLYMHGICCDIDVETGPRQLASHLLRKRLKLLRTVYPPPPGYAVFPEET
jgi:hypothetical protein